MASTGGSPLTLLSGDYDFTFTSIRDLYAITDTADAQALIVQKSLYAGAVTLVIGQLKTIPAIQAPVMAALVTNIEASQSAAGVESIFLSLLYSLRKTAATADIATWTRTFTTYAPAASSISPITSTYMYNSDTDVLFELVSAALTQAQVRGGAYRNNLNILPEILEATSTFVSRTLSN
jgi:energy-converting hydrogenase Eha subunit E